MRAAGLILLPVHYNQGIFYAPYPKVDTYLSGGPLGENGGHVSNIALSEADKIVKCPQSAFIEDAVTVDLRAEPDPRKYLVEWVPCGLWRICNESYICCHIKINGAVTE